MAYQRSWDESSPPGTLPADQIDTAIQNDKIATRERLEQVIPGFGDDNVNPKRARVLLTGSRAQRPTFTFGGVVYFAEDENALYYTDLDGTWLDWPLIGVTVGIAEARPNPPARVGLFYFAIDTRQLYISVPHENTIIWMETASGGVNAPTLQTAVWARTSALDEQITLTWLNVYPDREIQVYRSGVLLATLPPGTTTYNHTNSHPTVPLVGETLNSYTLRHTLSGATSPDSNVVTCWSGPLPPQEASIFADEGVAYTFHATWTDAHPSASVEVWEDYLCLNNPELRETQPPGSGGTTRRVGNSSVLAPVSPSTQGFEVRIRSKLESFTVTDYSDFFARSIDVLSDDNESAIDGYNTCP